MRLKGWGMRRRDSELTRSVRWDCDYMPKPGIVETSGVHGLVGTDQISTVGLQRRLGSSVTGPAPEGLKQVDRGVSPGVEIIASRRRLLQL